MLSAESTADSVKYICNKLSVVGPMHYVTHYINLCMYTTGKNPIYCHFCIFVTIYHIFCCYLNRKKEENVFFCHSHKLISLSNSTWFIQPCPCFVLFFLYFFSCFFLHYCTTIQCLHFNMIYY